MTVTVEKIKPGAQLRWGIQYRLNVHKPFPFLPRQGLSCSLLGMVHTHRETGDTKDLSPSLWQTVSHRFPLQGLQISVTVADAEQEVACPETKGC